MHPVYRGLSTFLSTQMANVLIGIVAAIHVYILVLEMFLWDRPAGRKAFGLTPEFAQQTRTLAANQGLYNGFLAAGLIWGLAQGADGLAFKYFFSCACWWQACMAPPRPAARSSGCRPCRPPFRCWPCIWGCENARAPVGETAAAAAGP